MTPDIAVHDVVQIIDDGYAWYPCLLLVTQVRPWGVQACVLIPKSNDGSQPPSEAYTRLTWEQIAYVGTAQVVPGPASSGAGPDG